MFGIFSEKPKDYVRILEIYDINIFDFNKEEFVEQELTIDDEVTGVNNKYCKNLNDSHLFDFLSISTKKDDSRNAVAMKEDANEKTFRNIVDHFYKYFGQDELFNNEFSQNDLYKIRGQYEDWLPDDNIRRWGTHYKSGFSYFVALSFDSKVNTIFLTVHSRKTYAIDQDKKKVPTLGYKK